MERNHDRLQLVPGLLSVFFGKYLGQHIVDGVKLDAQLLGRGGRLDAVDAALGAGPHGAQQDEADESLGFFHVEFRLGAKGRQRGRGSLGRAGGLLGSVDGPLGGFDGPSGGFDGPLGGFGRWFESRVGRDKAIDFQLG